LARLTCSSCNHLHVPVVRVLRGKEQTTSFGSSGGDGARIVGQSSRVLFFPAAALECQTAVPATETHGPAPPGRRPSVRVALRRTPDRAAFRSTLTPPPSILIHLLNTDIQGTWYLQRLLADFHPISSSLQGQKLPASDPVGYEGQTTNTLPMESEKPLQRKKHRAKL